MPAATVRQSNQGARGGAGSFAVHDLGNLCGLHQIGQSVGTEHHCITLLQRQREDCRIHARIAHRLRQRSATVCFPTNMRFRQSLGRLSIATQECRTVADIGNGQGIVVDQSSNDS
ncbi:MAG: hypothetical protein KatS3mg058_2543 [Roseiflexus sp.]|nr:MAG: hypothetical protein KatS3mg058_2543 [Roseiflexus sp.]